MQCVMTNLKGAAPSQMLGMDYTSMFSFNGERFGTTSSGLYEITTGQFDGIVPIDAYFVLATIDFGEKYKRLRYLYFGLEGTGNLLLTVTADRSTVREYTIPLDGTAQQRTRVKMDRNVKGRYWSFKVANVDGCDFSVDSMQVLHF